MGLDWLSENGEAASAVYPQEETTMKQRLNQLVTIASIGLLAGALIKELTRPAGERTWHGSIVGVPYDFRIPTLSRVLARWWNPDDERIFTPDVFGVGWSINLYQLRRQVLLLIA